MLDTQNPSPDQDDLDKIRGRLEDVPWEGAGWPLDDEIRELVAACNLYAETLSSCAGHTTEERESEGYPYSKLKYPEITFDNNQDLSELNEAIGEYNQKADLEWVLGYKGAGQTFLVPEPASEPTLTDDACNLISPIIRKTPKMILPEHVFRNNPEIKESHTAGTDFEYSEKHDLENFQLESKELAIYLIDRHPKSGVLE